jgi:hypothetical protein
MRSLALGRGEAQIARGLGFNHFIANHFIARSGILALKKTPGGCSLIP